MSESKPPELARCDDHGLVLLKGDGERLEYCPACDLNIDARPEHEVAGSEVTQSEFRNRMDQETAEALIPLMRSYLDDVQDGDPNLWMTHMEFEGDPLPAGYTEQERFIPVLVFTSGARVQYIIKESNARETIEALREKGYGG